MDNVANNVKLGTVIATVGLPRSGKSTLIRKLAQHLMAPIVEQDSVRLALHGKPYIPQTEEFVKAIAGVMTRSLLISGHKFVCVDETNYSRYKRATLISPQWDTVFLMVDTSADICKERAALTKQEYLIPVIDEMVARYESPGSNGEFDNHPQVTVHTRFDDLVKDVLNRK